MDFDVKVYLEACLHLVSKFFSRDCFVESLEKTKMLLNYIISKLAFMKLETQTVS